MVTSYMKNSERTLKRGVFAGEIIYEGELQCWPNHNFWLELDIKESLK